MHSFLAATARRSSDAQPSAPCAGRALGELSQDELILVAAAGTPATVACMAMVSRLWRSVGTSAAVWRALADSYWIGPISCRCAKSERHAVQSMERMLRLVCSGQRRLCVLVEQDGRLCVPLASSHFTVPLRRAPFRLIFAMGGERPLFCVSLCSSERGTVYEQSKSRKPLASFAVDRMYEEELQEDDAYMYWQASSSPGLGLLLDENRHQCMMWDVEPCSAAENTRAALAAVAGLEALQSEAPVWGTPPWSTPGAPQLLALCGSAVSHIKREAGDEAWVAIEKAYPDPLHVVAVQQMVSVNNGQYALSQMRELAREWIRIEWQQQQSAVD